MHNAKTWYLRIVKNEVLYVYVWQKVIRKSKIVLIVDDWKKKSQGNICAWSKGWRVLSGKVGLSLCNIYFIKITERTDHSYIEQYVTNLNWFKLSKCQVKNIQTPLSNNLFIICIAFFNILIAFTTVLICIKWKKKYFHLLISLVVEIYITST